MNGPAHSGGASLKLRGKAVSPGIAIGPAHVMERGMPETSEYCLTAEHLAAEAERFLNALENTRNHLKEVRERLLTGGYSQELLYLLDAHRMILEDRMLREGVLLHIRQGCNAEWAVKRHLAQVYAVFNGMEDPYLREKRRDIDQVIRQLLNFLIGGEGEELFARFPHPVVLVAEEFSPADTLLMDQESVLGFVTEAGGRTSHTAILARSLGLPAVVGVAGACQRVASGDRVVVDGLTGLLHLNPTPEREAEFMSRRSRYQAFHSALLENATQPAETSDGRRIIINANINFSGDALRARRMGADGVGLYRVEHLYMNRLEPPSEEEILAACRRVIEGMDGRPVTIRTMDVGGDKNTALFTRVARPGGGLNPALGLRAIRLCLKRERAAFITQLRAFLRASALGPVRLMLPMVTDLPELREALALLAQVREELSREGIPFDPGLKVGMMVEVPSAALCAHRMAQHVDFFSIGSNDLVQYTLAADRLDDAVAYLYNPAHPAVLRLMAMTIEAARERGIPVAVCGEMAGDPRLAFLLTGMGVDELSITPSCLPLVRRVIRGVDQARAREAARAAIVWGEEEPILDYLDRQLKEQLGEGYRFQ